MGYRVNKRAYEHVPERAFVPTRVVNSLVLIFKNYF